MSTKLKCHDLDTTGWNEFPFSAKGVNFISKVSNRSHLLSRILNLAPGVFDEMNRSAVSDFIDDVTSAESIAERLNFLNEGATHAVLELA
jgi:hypothetical protein